MDVFGKITLRLVAMAVLALLGAWLLIRFLPLALLMAAILATAFAVFCVVSGGDRP